LPITKPRERVRDRKNHGLSHASFRFSVSERRTTAKSDEEITDVCPNPMKGQRSNASVTEIVVITTIAEDVFNFLPEKTTAAVAVNGSHAKKSKVMFQWV
jgi:hypothetical protein